MSALRFVNMVRTGIHECAPDDSIERVTVGELRRTADMLDDLYAALDRIAAYNFDAPPWQAVEHEVKLIASTALAKARGEQSL